MSTIIDQEHDTDPELPSYIQHDIHEVNLHNPPPDTEEDTLISNLEPEPPEKQTDSFTPNYIFLIAIIIYMAFIILL